MEETEREEGVVLVVKVKEEERRVREIERWVLRKKRVLPTRHCSSEPADFFGEVGI